MKRFLGLLVVVVSLSTGCASVWAGSPPPCPYPDMDSIEDLAMIMAIGDYPNLVGWISEMERYCSGIEAMRDA